MPLYAKKASAAMRETVSKSGKAYVKLLSELDREMFREYVLSVRHSPPEGQPREGVLSDWLPVCEVVVADKQAWEVRKGPNAKPVSQFHLLSEKRKESILHRSRRSLKDGFQDTFHTSHTTPRLL